MTKRSRNEPSGNGETAGRDAKGRFAQGNKLGRGQPSAIARQTARLRQALHQSVTVADIREITTRLVAQAKAGDIPAVKILLERLLGQPTAIDVEERIAVLERIIEEIEQESEAKDEH